MMDISFSNEFGYMSASSFSQEMFFYSAPTSPSRHKSRAPSGFHTGSTTPTSTTTHEDANSNDEFEFETSRRFNVCDYVTETDQKEDNPFEENMAFADELFCEGKVKVLPMMPPLKLPPRLVKNGDGNMMSKSNQSSTVTSPRSPGSLLRLPFSRHSLWNDDFDPFMVALEKVKEEKRGKAKAKKHGLRRTRSLSPFRGFKEKNVRLSQSPQPESHCCGNELVCELKKEPLNEELERVNVLCEPKGLVFARQVRLVGVGNDANFENKRISVSKLAMVETKKGESGKGGFWTTKSKRENIKRFLFGNAKARVQAQHKLQEQKGKTPLLRKQDMKSVTPTQSSKWDKDKTTGELTKMRLLCHRPLPRFFLCLGYEGWKVK